MNTLKEGWEVEYCDNLPRDEHGDADIDRATYVVRDFATKRAALRYAKKVLPLSAFGSVRVTQFYSERYEPELPATFREYLGESIFIEQ